MNRIKFVVVVVFLSLVPYVVFSQSRAEKKKLKQELKQYKKMKPMDVRAMKLNYENKLKDKKNQEAQSKLLQKKIDSLQGIVNSSATRLASLESQLQSAQSEASSAKKGIAKGYYYRVQLGAYKFFDVKAKNSKQDDSFLTESSNDVDKYVVGLFFSLEEADKFKNDIRKLGIKDAFVVPYKDGQRVTHKEALEGLKKQNSTIKPNSGSSNVEPSKSIAPSLASSTNTGIEKAVEKILPPDFYKEYILVSIKKFDELNYLNVSNLKDFRYSTIDDGLTASNRKPAFRAKTKSTAGGNNKGSVNSNPNDKQSAIADIRNNRESQLNNNSTQSNNSNTTNSANKNSNNSTEEDAYKFESSVNPAVLFGMGDADRKPEVQKMTYKELQDAAFSFRQV